MLQFSFMTDTSCQNPSCSNVFPMHPDFFVGVQTETGRRMLLCYECIERVRVNAAALLEEDDDEDT